MDTNPEYRYLLADYWSPTKLLFVRDPRKIRADWIYGQLVGEDARTPEEVAADYNLPLDAIYEVIDYCTRNADLVLQERAKDVARWEEYERNHPLLRPEQTNPPS